MSAKYWVTITIPLYLPANLSLDEDDAETWIDDELCRVIGHATPYEIDDYERADNNYSVNLDQDSE